jgi:hypothetical protein
MDYAFSGVFPICFRTAAIFVHLFIAPAFYGKLGFDDFWAPILWKYIRRQFSKVLSLFALNYHYFSVLNSFYCFFYFRNVFLYCLQYGQSLANLLQNVGYLYMV